MSTKTFLNSISYLIFFVIISLNASCGALLAYGLHEWLDDGGNSAETTSPTAPAIEATSTYSIALGGVAPGRDELILTDEGGNLVDLSGQSISFKSDTDVVGLLPRPSFEDYTSGSGAQIIPQRPGFATISYYINDVLQSDKFSVIIPPQSLIQMMVSEASTQISAEADVGADYNVLLSSVSPTADAIGAVTRNRINLIIKSLDCSLFNVSEGDWSSSPPASYYDAVISAQNDGIYQYLPVDPSDPAHDTYNNAEARSFLETSYQRAYDQAVLSAANIFADKTKDPTNGAFAFFSPTLDEWAIIELAYDNNMHLLPVGCGVSDDDFPSFAPIQILILENIWTYPDGRPSFVFIRSRDATEKVVTRTP